MKKSDFLPYVRSEKGDFRKKGESGMRNKDPTKKES